MTNTAQILAVGDHIHLAHGGDERRWWTVRAVDERYAICTMQAQFRPKGTVQYTILDLQEKHRGPCNLVGQGWDFNSDTLNEDAEALLIGLNGGRNTDAAFIWAVEISTRNRVPLVITEIRRSRRA